MGIMKDILERDNVIRYSNNCEADQIVTTLSIAWNYSPVQVHKKQRRAEQDVTTDEEPSVGLKEGHMSSNMKEKVNHKSFITNLYVINTDWKNKF